jgi:hypothetical protein
MDVATCLMGVVLALGGGPAESLSDDEVLRQADAAFEAGCDARDHPSQARPHFRKAAHQYEILRQRGIRNAALYRNQGNASLLAGDLAQAILAYRRGLSLHPGDPTLRANLAYARGQVVYPETGNLGRPPVDYLPPWLPRPAPVVWLVLYVAFYSAGWLALPRWLMTQRGGWLVAGLGAFGVAAVLAAGLAVQAWMARQETLHPLVVVAEDGVALRSGNGLAYPPRYQTPLNRGVEARLLYRRGTWLQIELAGGQVGWVPASAVLVDVPPDAEPGA